VPIRPSTQGRDVHCCRGRWNDVRSSAGDVPDCVDHPQPPKTVSRKRLAENDLLAAFLEWAANLAPDRHGQYNC